MSATPDEWTLTARWILPVTGAPLENGTVTIAGDLITAVEPRGRRTPDVDLGNSAVIPGLVNAHTHLDLSSVPGRVPFDGDFTNWLRGVIGHRRTLTPDQIDAAVRAGLAEGVAHGTTLLGDIAGQGLSWDVLAAARCRAVVFYELLGLIADRVKERNVAVVKWLRQRSATLDCRPGLGPHAPYSASRSLVRSAVHAAFNGRLPLAIHLAETLDEIELLEFRTGQFVTFLKEVGAVDEAGHAILQTYQQLGDVLSACRHVPALFVHANYLDPEAAVYPHQTIVYCPRTHAYFGHSPHPFRDFLQRGVRVALGTDSRASNPDLDLLADARFLHGRYPDVPGPTVLWMATLAGAEALGFADVTGSLVPGKSADLVAVPLPNEDERDPYTLLFESDLPGRRTMWRGRWRP